MANLNKLIDEITNILSNEKAYDLPRVCERYDLDIGDEDEAYHSKRVYVQRRLKGKDQLFLLDLAMRIIDDFGEEARSLSKLIATISPSGVFAISEITRRNILDELYDRDFWGKLDIITFLKRVWDLDKMPSTDSRYENATGDIWQHMINNSDYDMKYLLEEYLELLIVNDEEFISFLEQLVHPVVRDTAEQNEYISNLGEKLINDGFKYIPTDQISGYPVYKIKKTEDGVEGAVKNLIFAAIGNKPEIVISDSLNNDIRIVRNKDNCLIYDRPITNDGLFWTDLVGWWDDINSSYNTIRESEVSLYRRLQDSLDSAPEKIFLKNYYSFKGQYKENLPALIPQVYLHYDPYTKNQRNGEIYLPRQRMDFLLLLPYRQRIVIEIDGKHHYSIGDKSSPLNYSKMVSADRDLKLHGYEVYRFGGYELMNEEKGAESIKEFIIRLFDKYNIKEGGDHRN